MARRFFVKVFAPTRQALVGLQGFDLDLFAQTATETQGRCAIDGLVTLQELERLVDAGYQVLVEEEASRRARAHREVSGLDDFVESMEG
ncbi:MAG: hypothetical protein M3N52_07580 [Actinomycetota bacterium]|nr:hypothetical protein [Actinomycetota bacterium]